MTTITQKEAYRLAARLAKEGMKHSKISKELSRAGWLSRKTGKPLSPGAISMIVKWMNTPGYKPVGFKPEKYAEADLAVHAPQSQGFSCDGAPTPTQIQDGIQAATTAAHERFAGAYREIRDIAERHQRLATALHTLLDAVR